MTSISSLLSKKIGNIKAVIGAEYEKDAESEDPNAYRELQEHIIRKNAGRISVFSAFSFIGGVLEIIFGVGSVICYTGAVLLIITSVVMCWLCTRTLLYRSPDHSLLRLYNIIYWCLFSTGVLIVTVSEHLSGNFPYSFLFFLAAVVSVPVVKFHESLIFAAVMLIFPIIYGIVTEKELIYYIAVIAVTAAYIWIAAIVRCCYANIRISEHRLEMTEERCTQISRKDTLTGLLNKAGMSAKFEELTRTPDTSISVILIDVDNFRAYNHMYGYAASDGCLYRICNCIKIIAKPYTEFISRFGGDDFVLVLENMNVVDSVKIAEQLRESIETMAQPFGNGIVTVSIGVSGPAKLENADTYSVLLNEADDQLIVAKRSGKNCIGFRGKPFIHESRRPSSGR